MKRSLSILLLAAMLLTLAACGGTESAPQPEEEAEVVAAEPDEEILRAISYGLITEEDWKNTGKTITHKQLCEIITRMVALRNEELVPEWEELAAMALQSDEIVHRDDAILALFEAAIVMGTDRWQGAALYDSWESDLFTGDDWWEGASRDYDLFPNWEEPYPDVHDGNMDYDIFAHAAWHLELVYSPVSMEMPIAPTENFSFGFDQEVSVDEAIRAVTRYAEAFPVILDEDAVYLSLNDIAAYDKTIITNELLAAPSELPEVTQEKLPGEWQGAGISKGKDLRADVTDYRKYRESDIIFLAENGFNFTRIFFSLSSLRFPDFPEDARQVNENELKELDQLIAWGIEHGVHIQISNSYYLDENGDNKTNSALPVNNEEWTLYRDYCTMLARRYAGISSRYLSFDLCNEAQPNGDEDISQYVAGMEQVVASMREADSERVLLYSYPGNPDMAWVEAMAQVGLAIGCHPYYPQNITTGNTGAGEGDYFEPCWPMPVLPAWQISTQNAPLILRGEIDGAELSIHVGKSGPNAYLEVFADGILTETLVVPGGVPDENGECWYGEEMLTTRLPEGISEVQIWVRNEDAHIDTVIVDGNAGRTPIVFSSDEESDPSPMPVLIQEDGSYANEENTTVSGEDIYNHAIRPSQELAERYGVGFMVNEFGIFTGNVSWDINLVAQYHADVIAMLEAHNLPWCYCDLYNSIPKHIVVMGRQNSQWTGATTVEQSYGGNTYMVCQELLDVFRQYTME